MKNMFALASLIALSACAAPEISDWPPKAPPVDQAIIDSYVDRYAGDYKAPSYGPEDLDALRILHMRQFRAGDNGQDEVERLRAELDDIRAKMALDNDATVAPERSRGEINAIKNRIDRHYEGAHERKYERLKAGI